MNATPEQMAQSMDLMQRAVGGRPLATVTWTDPPRLLIVSTGPDRQDLVVLGMTDGDGDTAALSLDAAEARRVRDALTGWLEAQA